jgi:hypothetical protein
MTSVNEYLKLIDDTIANGRYKADWSFLSAHKIPDWYYKAKFGIFIHWGIYGTTPWKQFSEGSANNSEGSFKDNDGINFTSKDYRFTYKEGCLYAFCMHPDSNEFCIRSLSKAEHAEVLGDYTVTACGNTAEGLKIVIDRQPASDKPLGFKISLLN